ncbi:MAG TPA: hypothetical protein VIL20_25525 [Sandaracinaceae bacterium]
MITTMSKEELIRIGADLRSAYLLQQSGYTLAIARAEGEPLAALLEPGYLDEVEAAEASVKASQADRDLMRVEAGNLTAEQDRKVREAKLWRRKVAKRGSRRRRMGHPVPDELTKVGRANTVPALLQQLTTMIASFELSIDAMGGDQARALLEEGRRVHGELAAVDAAQETARLASLPQKVRDFYEAKGLLYVGLKVINDAGQELHAGDPAQAAQYNLRILHRRAGKRGPGEG